MKTEQDFQKFYYTKVALGEWCGCAERVIDIHEADRKAGAEDKQGPKRQQKLSDRLRNLRVALGLY